MAGSSNLLSQTPRPAVLQYCQGVRKKSDGDDNEDDVESQISGNLDSPKMRKVLLDAACTAFTFQPGGLDFSPFMAARTQNSQPSQFYSLLFEYSLLVVSASRSTSRAVRKLALTYLHRAKQEIHRELENPTLGTVLGFIVLSEYQGARGQHRLGSTYAGTHSFACLVTYFDCVYLRHCLPFGFGLRSSRRTRCSA